MCSTILHGASDLSPVWVGILLWQPYRHAYGAKVHHTGGELTNADRTRKLKHHCTTLSHLVSSPVSASRHAWAGRAAIVFMAIFGTLPLLAGPSALDATTVSGTMVVGLGPPVFALIFLKGYRPLVFHLPFWTGVAFAVVMQLSTSPCCKDSMNVAGFNIGTGHYATLLGFNVVSAVCCWFLGAVALLDNTAGRNLTGRELGLEESEEYGEDQVGGKGQVPTLPITEQDLTGSGNSRGPAALPAPVN